MKNGSKKRDAIILATKELAAEKGMNCASTILIAEKAETAEVTIFRHFKTKEALLQTVFDEEVSRLREFLLKNHDETLPVKDRFFDLCDKALQFFFDSYIGLSFMEQYLHSPLGWKRNSLMHNEEDDRFEGAPLRHLLKKGIEQKIIKDLALNVLMGIVAGGMVAFARECYQDGLKYDAKKANDVVGACWDAVRN